MTRLTSTRSISSCEIGLRQYLFGSCLSLMTLGSWDESSAGLAAPNDEITLVIPPEIKASINENILKQKDIKHTLSKTNQRHMRLDKLQNNKGKILKIMKLKKNIR